MLKFCKVAVTGESGACQGVRLSAEASLQRRTGVIIYVRKEAKTEVVAGWVTLWLDERASGQDQEARMWKWRWLYGSKRVGRMGKGSQRAGLEERLLGMVCDVTAEWVAEERGEKTSSC